MKILVGNTGFVGSNIYSQIKFDKFFNSINIHYAFGLNPDICIYAGIRAQKFLANMNPEEDLKHIFETIENIKKINPKKLVLISTIDVFDYTVNVDENHIIDNLKVMPYGKHRKILEDWVIKNVKDYHIIRLSGLFGENLKKNYLFDIINPIPSILSEHLFLKYKGISQMIENTYKLKDNKFYYLKEDLNFNQRKDLYQVLKTNNLTAIQFTHSQTKFQFYPLNRLANDINIIINNNIRIIQLVTEPVIANEVYRFIFNEDFNNKTSDSYQTYDIKTIYSNFWNRSDGYLMSKNQVLDNIKMFIDSKTKGENF